MSYSLEEHRQKALHPGVLSERAEIRPAQSDGIPVLRESAQGTSRKLTVQMEAIHTGRTANYTYYTKEGLSSGIQSWTSPYPKPVLTHHNDQDGEPIGRITKAEYTDITPSGKGGLVFTCEISDPAAIEKVLDGRYRTVSIGATTDRVTCNICGTNRTEAWCDHFPGETYEEQTCHLIVGTTIGREVSYVNVPADEFAQNVSVHVQESGKELPEMKSGAGEAHAAGEVRLAEKAGGTNPSSGVEGTERSMEMTEDESKLQEGEAQAEAPAELKEQEAQEEKNGSELDELKSRIETLETELAAEKAEGESLKKKLAEETQEKEALLEENRRMIEESHRTLAEKVVEMKRTLGKPDVQGKTAEDAVSSHLSRSAQSLRDTLSDLKEEAKHAKPEAGSVQNPGQPAFAEEEQKQKMIDKKEAENILKSFFGGKRK